MEVGAQLALVGSGAAPSGGQDGLGDVHAHAAPGSGDEPDLPAGRVSGVLLAHDRQTLRWWNVVRRNAPAPVRPAGRFPAGTPSTKPQIPWVRESLL